MTMLINPYRYGLPSLLDQVAAAAAAYSARRLRDGYAGAALRVRRSSDNAEQDIGFAAGNLDEAALTSFTGAGSGNVVTWYDQTGNGRHATQTAAARQPRIVNGGTVDTKNTKPCLVLDGGDVLKHVAGSNIFATAALTAVAVGHVSSGAANYARFVSLTSSGLENDYDNNSFAAAITRVALSASVTSFRVAAKSSQSVVYDQLAVMTSLFDGTDHTMRVDGSAGTPVGSTGSFGAAAVVLGSYIDPPVDPPLSALTGGLAEVVLWDSALSATDRDTVETDAAGYFGTP